MLLYEALLVSFDLWMIDIASVSIYAEGLIKSLRELSRLNYGHDLPLLTCCSILHKYYYLAHLGIEWHHSNSKQTLVKLNFLFKAILQLLSFKLALNAALINFSQTSARTNAFRDAISFEFFNVSLFRVYST